MRARNQRTKPLRWHGYPSRALCDQPAPTARVGYPRHRESRRAFALAFALLLFLVGGLFVGAALERHSAQQRVVERQVDEYRLHHEMFGVQAITQQWVQRALTVDIIESANTGQVAFGFAMPGSNKRIAVYVEDGQDTVLVTGVGVEEDLMDFYTAMLQRLPEDRPELLRGAGPAAISLNRAPAPVVEAIFGEDLADAAARLLTRRERSTLTRADLTDALQRAGATPEQIRAITRLTTFSPSLWRLRIETAAASGPREFEMLVEKTETRPMMHGWRERFAAGPETDTPAARRRGR